MTLSDYTDQELQDEIERRAQNPPPNPIANHDWSSVVNLCQDNIESVWKEGRDIKDVRVYVYEAAMVAVFGKDIFSRIAERKR